MKYGMILKIENGMAAVMKHGGEFVTVRAGKGWKEGSLVRLPAARLYPRSLVAAAACLLVVCSASAWGVGSYYSEAAVVSLDVNPSIELVANRFNRVIGAVSYNREGREILERSHVKNKTLEDAIDELFISGLDRYIGKSTYVTLTVQSDDKEKEERLLAEAKAVAEQAVAMSEAARAKGKSSAAGAAGAEGQEGNPAGWPGAEGQEGSLAGWPGAEDTDAAGTVAAYAGEMRQAQSPQVVAYAVDKATVESAHGHHVTAGKYMALMELQEVMPDMNVEEYSNCSISEIRRQIDTCSEAHGSRSGHNVYTKEGGAAYSGSTGNTDAADGNSGAAGSSCHERQSAPAANRFSGAADGSSTGQTGSTSGGAADGPPAQNGMAGRQSTKNVSPQTQPYDDRESPPGHHHSHRCQ